MNDTIKVRRTTNGPHPSTAVDRIWNKGDEGDMLISEALPRIEHGLFEAVDPEEYEAVIDEQMASARTAEAVRIEELAVKSATSGDE
jgi:hypothetical protein